jgi:hypothetical protein
VFLTATKALELHGESPEEPAEVQVARQDINQLQHEKERTERIRQRIRQELHSAKERAAKIEEVNILLIFLNCILYIFNTAVHNLNYFVYLYKICSTYKMIKANVKRITWEIKILNT